MFYSSSIESEIKKLYNSLSEKDKRRYAAIEAQKLGWGGISYIMKLCGCSRNTIVQGIKDLETMNETTINNLRIRKKGGGRKSILATRSGIDEAFLEVLKFQTAGDPMNELIKWTNLTYKEIAVRTEKRRILCKSSSSRTTPKKTWICKAKSTKKTDDRN